MCRTTDRSVSLGQEGSVDDLKGKKQYLFVQWNWYWHMSTGCNLAGTLSLQLLQRGLIGWEV